MKANDHEKTFWDVSRRFHGTHSITDVHFEFGCNKGQGKIRVGVPLE